MTASRLLLPLLALALSGALGAAATREAETFETRLARTEVLAAQANARRQLKAGDARSARREIEGALTVARHFGLSEEEVGLDETYADYLLAQGDPMAATEWLQRGWRLALALAPPRPDLARHALARLAEVHESLGEEHLADQAAAWVALIDGAPDAPVPSVDLQPLASSTRIANSEIGRTRLFLANASLSAVTGTLLVDGGDLLVKDWKSRGESEAITLQFPASASVVPESSAQGRRIILQPGETRTIVVEVEPGAPPRVTDRTVTVSWQAGTVSSTSIAEFHFGRPREFPATSAANACHVRLNPLVSVPVVMEVYHRGGRRRHLQDLWPVTSAPCRVELYEVVSAGTTSRQLLAVDANGDGRFDAPGDAVVADRDRTGFPEVAFAPEKPVAALELRLYPLPSADGSVPETLDLSVSLRDGISWRVPPDVDHRIKTR